MDPSGQPSCISQSLCGADSGSPCERSPAGSLHPVIWGRTHRHFVHSYRQRVPWTVEDHLRNKPEASVALFHRFVDLLSSIGPFLYSPSKTTVTFKGSRRGFAGARPDRRGLVGYLDLQRIVEDPRITSVSPYTAKLFTHHFRINALEQLDETFLGWLREAHAVGEGAHVRAPGSSITDP